MNAWFPPRRARATRSALILSAALVVAGLVPLLYFVGLVGWQIVTLVQTRSWVPLPASLLFTEHSFAFIPQLPGHGWRARIRFCLRIRRSCGS